MLHRPRAVAAAAPFALIAGLTATAALVPGAPALAAETTVALVGSLQSELGCAADWDPACAETELALGEDGTYAAEFEVPAGAWEYKVALDDSWDVSYGRDGGSDNAPLVLGGAARLRVSFDPETHRIGLTPLDLSGEYSEADDALVAAPARVPGGDERFYFVMTDRFANGDPSNDDGGLGDDPLVSGFDPTNKGFYQGGDLAGLRSKLDYIEGLGTTAIWLTPSFLNRAVQGTGANASAGYHGYWITDFTRIDPHLGTNEELEALIDDAHARGIKVYFDIITNHTADVVDYADGSYGYVDKAASPYKDAAGNVFDPSEIAGSPDFPALDPATSFPHTPVIAPEDADVKVPAWLNDPTVYHNRGNSTWAGESVTFGDFDGLDDLMTEDPRVVDGFVDVYNTWVDLGIDGFRIDTVKHVNKEFWQTFTTAVQDHARSLGKDDFFMFGEVFDADARLTAPYVRDTDMSAVLDFAFQSGALSFASGNSAQGLANLFASDDLYTTPDTSASALPTFLGNHDMGRAGFMLASTADPLARDELAHELMYLTRGQPVVYYGDEQGFAGTGGDKDARQTLFATQVDEYANQPLVTGEQAGSQDRYDTDAPLYQHIAALAALREDHPALATGAQVERYADEGAGVYAFSRVDRDEKVEYLVAANNAAEPRTVTLTTLTPGASFAPLYGEASALTADAEGTVTLTVPATSAVVLQADRPVGADSAGTIAVNLPAAGAAVSGTAPVGADVDDDAWAETSFAWREVGTGEWQPLGTAEDTTPRVFHDVAGLPEGTLVEYRAVTTDADGDRAAASTFGSVGVDVSGVVPSEEPDPDGPVVTLPGSYQSEAGCPGDWQPDCLATQATDPDGDGVYTFTSAPLPAGSYEVKVAHGLSWAENYGVGGARDGANYSFAVGDQETVSFSYDLATHLLTIGVANPPLPGAGQQAAHWVRAGLVLVPPSLGSGDEWTLWSAPEGGLAVGDDDQLTVPEGATSYRLVPADGIPDDVAADFPALADRMPLRILHEDGTRVSRRELAGMLTGQLLVTRSDAEGTLTAATGVQLPGVLDDLYADDAAHRTFGISWDDSKGRGNDKARGNGRGDQRHGVPSFALWAPTAKQVTLLGWREDADLDGDPLRLEATREADGTWTVDGDDAGRRFDWDNARYLYEVRVFVPSTGAVETNTVTDPASVALTQGSTHSVVADLDDPRWAPQVWTRTKAPKVEKQVDQTIYELHVRDFSISDETVPAGLRGTYLAFGQQRSAGMTHLRELADAGLTTVHLLPTFDIATIPEDRDAQADPGDLSALPPDSDQQQAAVSAVKAEDGFNWGYDPFHWSTPEGSYATEADGGSRTAEFRTMVGSLHAAGLQVVLDQVFNHTSASGQDATSVLDQVVPGYYHRLDPTTGAVQTSTCCQNIATEHALAGKAMVDSVVTWARDYHVDGFRFDLMGHHSKQNLLDVRAALDELTLSRDGVDGKKVFLYGEGWDFGEVAGGALFEQATQGNLGGTGIATFSDRLRDAVHGGSPVDGGSVFRQGFGTGLFTDPNGLPAVRDDAATVNDGGDDELADLQHQTDLVELGLAGNLRDFKVTTADGSVKRGEELDYNGQPAGYADEPDEVITYVDAHDNETLFDLGILKLPTDTPMADRVRMNTVSLATTALAQTPSFWHAGTDLLRSKSLDKNSYDSGDWFNAIDWTGQDNGFARGLPMEADNGDRWAFEGPLLADPALKPAPSDIATASDQALDLLRLRSSTRLFRLGSADLIEQKVSFPLSGADATPGVITMSIDDTKGRDMDRSLDGVLVVFNASPTTATQTVPGLAGRDYELSRTQRRGADDVVRDTTWDRRTGTVTVPPRTVAVLTDPAR